MGLPLAVLVTGCRRPYALPQVREGGDTLAGASCGVMNLVVQNCAVRSPSYILRTTLGSYRHEFGVLRWLIEDAVRDSLALRGARGYRPNGPVLSGLVRERVHILNEDPTLLEGTRLELCKLNNDGVRVVLRGSSAISPRLHYRPETAHEAEPDLLDSDLGPAGPMGSVVIFFRPHGRRLGPVTLARVSSLDGWAFSCPVLQELPLPPAVAPAAAQERDRATTNDDGDDLDDVVNRIEEVVEDEDDQDEFLRRAVGDDENDERS